MFQSRLDKSVSPCSSNSARKLGLTQCADENAERPQKCSMENIEIAAGVIVSWNKSCVKISKINILKCLSISSCPKLLVAWYCWQLFPVSESYKVTHPLENQHSTNRKRACLLNGFRRSCVLQGTSVPNLTNTLGILCRLLQRNTKPQLAESTVHWEKLFQWTWNGCSVAVCVVAVPLVAPCGQSSAWANE